MTRQNRIILHTPLNPLRPRTATSPVPVKRLTQPGYDFSWSTFKSVQFMMNVSAVNGAPSAFSFHPRLEIGMTSGAYGYQDTHSVWKTLSPTEAAAMTVEGAWFPDITSSSQFGLYKVTINNPSFAMRINCGEYYSTPSGDSQSATDIALFNSAHADRLAFTGGTDPNLVVSLIAYPREK